MMSVNFGPVVTPRMGMRMKPGFRAPQRPQPLGGLQMAKLSLGGLPHDAPMSYVSRVDAMHGMPMHTLPDYMMSRMADGGIAEHPMVERYRRRRLAPFEAQLRARYDDQNENPFYWDPSVVTGGDRRSTAERDLKFAPERAQMAQRGQLPWWQDMLSSLADPTMLPLTFAGTTAKGLAGIAPRFLKRIPRIPLRASAGEFGAWSASDPNIEEASPEDGGLPWSMSEPAFRSYRPSF